MFRTSVRALLPGLLVVVAGCGAPSSDTEASASEMAAELHLENLRRTMEIAHEKFSSLAAEMPESTHDWAPMDGVRSVSDVFIHVAADNYFVPALLGVPAPAETGITDDVMTFREYQEQEMSRDEMLAALDASFEFFLSAMDQTADDLDREVTLGAPTTVGDVWIRAVVHVHEHLGQSIAYARTNEVVPPWSG